MVGTALGPYRIVEQLGKGGMGEVWLAEDTRLDRKVAVKVLPAEFAADRDRLSRFEQEAKAAAALNHPHIAAIHDVGVATVDGAETHYMVQEYLQGETLHDATSRGPMPLPKALTLAAEVASALKVAHRAGIVHRDLKPDNVFVSMDGHAKVLDFGLAKLTEMALPSGISASMSPTMTMAGQIMGTAGYMAPEQVQGEEVDERADLFAFGCVLYEMLTGKQAFGGDNVHESLSRILTGQPEPLAENRAALPGQLQWMVDKLLAKDREQRYQTAGDVVVDLRGLDPAAETAGPPPEQVAQSESSRRSPALLAAIGLVGILAGAIGGWILKPTAASAPVPDLTFALMLPDNQTFSSNYNRVVTISPDSRTVAYMADNALRLRTMGDTTARAIDDTTGGRSPAFSADSRQIAFWAGGNIKRVAIDGGFPVTVGSVRDRPLGMHWSSDGFIYFGRGDRGVWKIAAAGGEPEQVLSVESGEYVHGPELLPGGEWMLYTLGRGVRAWSDGSIVAQSLKDGERRVLVQRGRETRYLRSGYLAYVQGASLFAVPFDAGRVEVTGGATAMIDTVHTSWLDETGAASYDVSDDGVLVYVPPTVAEGERRLFWIDEAGAQTALPMEPRRFAVLRLSPDEKSFAVQINDTDGTHIWVYAVDRGGGQRLTVTGRNTSPTWSHDGRFVYFASDRDGDLDIWRRRADLSAPAEQVIDADGAQLPTSASRDGKWLLFARMAPSNSDIGRLSLDGKAEIEMLVESEADEFDPAISADGRFFAFQSDETGRWDVHVMEIESRRRWTVTPESGFSPTWSRDGKYILYVGDELMRVAVTTEPEFSVTAPEVAIPGWAGLQGLYEPASDGRRVITGRSEDADDEDRELRAHAVVVWNWMDQLERLQ